MKSILNEGRHPSAVFTATDELAIGAMEAVRQSNLSIPNDISFFGFGDYNMSSLITPTLSTVSVPLVEMGRRGAEELYNQIYKNALPSTKIILRHQLIIRDSVAKII